MVTAMSVVDKTVSGRARASGPLKEEETGRSSHQ